MEEKFWNMTVRGLQKVAREIWGEQRHTLEEIAVRAMVTLGDVARAARDGEPSAERPVGQRGNATERRDRWRSELQKELGNLIFSTIRWCDDLGFDPEECVRLAIEAQQAFVASGRPR